MNRDMLATVALPTSIIAGALAHLAQYIESGSSCSAYLAAMLLERVANDADVDEPLRQHAHQLVEILERNFTPASMDEANARGHAEPVRGNDRVGCAC